MRSENEWHWKKDWEWLNCSSSQMPRCITSIYLCIEMDSYWCFIYQVVAITSIFCFFDSIEHAIVLLFLIKTKLVKNEHQYKSPMHFLHSIQIILFLCFFSKSLFYFHNFLLSSHKVTFFAREVKQFENVFIVIFSLTGKMVQVSKSFTEFNEGEIREKYSLSECCEGHFKMFAIFLLVFLMNFQVRSIHTFSYRLGKCIRNPYSYFSTFTSIAYSWVVLQIL